jgi:undecaprenyl-diphosphatase
MAKSWIAPIVAVVLFTILAVLVRQAAVVDWESSLLLSLHSHTSHAFEEAMLNLNAIGGPKPVYAVIAISGLVWARRKQWRTAGFVVIGASVSGLSNLVLRDLLHRHRPELWHVLFYDHSFIWSFPSGHSCLAATVASSFAMPLRGKSSWPLALGLGLLYCFTVALTTLVLGVHFPLDVLAGWISGWLVMDLAWKVSRAAS